MLHFLPPGGGQGRQEGSDVFSVPPWVRKIGPGWAHLGLKLRYLSPTGAQLAPQVMLSWSWAQIDPDGPQIEHGVTCSPLATASRQVEPNGDTTWKHCLTRSVIDTQKTWEASMKTHVLRISAWADHVPHFEALWTSTWAEVAPKWVQPGAKLRHLGAKMGQKLEPGGSKLGRSWGLGQIESVHLDDAVPVW